jgi:hypothetical protein
MTMTGYEFGYTLISGPLTLKYKRNSRHTTNMTTPTHNTPKYINEANSKAANAHSAITVENTPSSLSKSTIAWHFVHAATTPGVKPWQANFTLDIQYSPQLGHSLIVYTHDLLFRRNKKLPVVRQ